MAKGELKLGLLGSESTLSAFGRTFTITDNEYAKIERTANCRLMKDIKENSPKKTFTLDYSMIDGDDLEAYITLYELGEILSLIVYTGVSTYNQYDVVMSPINRERVSLLDDGLWSGVTITLDEI